jgi:hypothetical protein
MNHLDVGLDKGRSKTNLAVARADGHLVLEARIEHYDPFDPQPITESRLLHLIAQHLTPFKAHPLSLFGGGCFETPRSFFDGLSGDGFDIQALEVFTNISVLDARLHSWGGRKERHPQMENLQLLSHIDMPLKL